MIRMLSFIIVLELSQPSLLEDVLRDVAKIVNHLSLAFQNCSLTAVNSSDISSTLFTKDDSQIGARLADGNFDEVNSNASVTFVIHGWLQSDGVAWVSQMKDAYLNQAKDTNVVVVDWSAYSGNSYAEAYCAVPAVGNVTGDLIDMLVATTGVALEKIQIVGFSLGAQIAGYAGQRVQAITGGQKIGRIDGLDASGPGFIGYPEDQRLDASDAENVQGIHTNGGQFGYADTFGKVDFFVNYALTGGCGVQQSGCPLFPGIPISSNASLQMFLPYFFCSHAKAIAYYLESIESKEFVGVACQSCTRFGLWFCKSSANMTIMGEHCPFNVTGSFYLRTNANSPFARGV